MALRGGALADSVVAPPGDVWWGCDLSRYWDERIPRLRPRYSRDRPYLQQHGQSPKRRPSTVLFRGHSGGQSPPHVSNRKQLSAASAEPRIQLQPFDLLRKNSCLICLAQVVRTTTDPSPHRMTPVCHLHISVSYALVKTTHTVTHTADHASREPTPPTQSRRVLACSGEMST